MRMINVVKHDFQNLIYMVKYFFNYGKIYFIVHFFVVFLTNPVTTVLNIYMQKEIIDSITIGNSWISVILLILLFQIAFFLMSIINQVFLVYSTPVSEQIIEKLNKMVYNKAIHADLKNFSKSDFYNNYAWTIDNFSDQANQAKNLLIDFSTNLLSITAIITIIVILDHFLLLIIVIHIIISSIIKRFRIKHGYKLNSELIDSTRIFEYIKRIFYDPQNAIELKCNRSSFFLFKKYDYNTETRKNVRFKYATKFLIFLLSDAANVIVLNLIILSYLTYQIIHNGLSIGSFIALTSASLALSNILSNLLNTFNQIHEISLYVNRVKCFMYAESNIELMNNNNPDFELLEDDSFSLELKNVGFRYDKRKNCLRKINLIINKGEKIAIVGKNGAGKSTLVKLLLRLYDVNKGEILINNKSIKSYDIVELRKKIGIAFQRPLIYALTLSENMQLYANADDKILINALRKVGLNDIIENTKKGLHSEMTKEFCDEGIVLSGGGEQRLGVSRLFIGKFGMLILDEPFSALDPLAEFELNNTIFDLNNKITTIVISHRLSNINSADSIYLMDNGTIVESGNHDELMKLNGKYAEMFYKQANA